MMSNVNEFFDSLEHDGAESADRDVNEDFVNLAVNLARTRRAMGLTQAELAEMVGTSQPRVAEIEGGQGNPTFRTLAKLARALGVAVASLVAISDESPPIVTYDVTNEDLEGWGFEGWEMVIREAGEAANTDLALVA